MTAEIPAHQIAAFVVMLGLLIVAPFFLYPIFLMKALCFALFACAFSLLIGYVGLLSFGHAAFLGSAGYVSAHAAKVWGLPPELAILAGTAAGAVLGLAIGALAIRSRGIYFANITLALAQMIYFFALQAKFTGGEDGIQSVPQGRLLGVLDLRQPYTLYFVVLAIFLLGFLIVYRAIHSPFGQVLKAIRENESRGDLARLSRRALQADRLRAVGHAVGPGRRDQGARLPARLAHRRALDDVGRGGAHDAARWPRHRLRTGGGRLHHDRRWRTTWPRSAPGSLSCRARSSWCACSCSAGVWSASWADSSGSRCRSGRVSGIFDRDLDRNAANSTPLTPLSFLSWAAHVYPEKTAVIHGERTFTYAEFQARCRRLASALSRRGIGRGDTVAVMAPNVPALLEAHYGVPMVGAVLNALNYRLDARTIAFILEHGEAKLLITDREFSPTVEQALALLGRRLPVIDIDDPLYEGGRLLGEKDYEALLAEGDPAFAGRPPEDEWQAICLLYTSGTTGDPRASSTITAAPI